MGKTAKEKIVKQISEDIKKSKAKLRAFLDNSEIYNYNMSLLDGIIYYEKDVIVNSSDYLIDN